MSTNQPPPISIPPPTQSQEITLVNLHTLNFLLRSFFSYIETSQQLISCENQLIGFCAIDNTVK